MPRVRLNLPDPFLAIPNACLSSFFTYHNDCEESDIELLTSFFNSSDTTVHPGLQLMNQNRQCDHSKNTHTHVAYPADPTTGEHEVRYSPPASPSRLTSRTSVVQHAVYPCLEPDLRPIFLRWQDRLELDDQRAEPALVFYLELVVRRQRALDRWPSHPGFDPEDQEHLARLPDG